MAAKEKRQKRKRAYPKSTCWIHIADGVPIQRRLLSNTWKHSTWDKHKVHNGFSLVPRVIQTVIYDSRERCRMLDASICMLFRERKIGKSMGCKSERKENKADIKLENPKEMGCGLLTCQLVSGRPETRMRNMVRRGRGIEGRSIGPEKFSLRRGPRANCTVSRSPLKSLPSV